MKNRVVMMLVSMVLVGGVFMAGHLVTSSMADDSEIVNIPDQGLKEVLATVLGKDISDPVTKGELKSIKEISTGVNLIDYLKIKKYPIKDLTGIEYCQNLTMLNLDLMNMTTPPAPEEIGGFVFDNISDLTPLAGLTKLEVLELRKNSIVDITPLGYLKKLVILDLAENKISDVAPLTNLTNLDFLDLSYNSIADISLFAKFSAFKTKPLHGLFLAGNHISNIDALSNFTSLIALSLTKNRVGKVDPLAKLCKLQDLDLGNNQISDITKLRKLKALTSLSLAINKIKDISALAHLNKLKELNLSALAKKLGGNVVIDITPLIENPGIGAGDNINLSENKIKPPDGVQQLEQKGANVLL